MSQKRQSIEKRRHDILNSFCKVAEKTHYRDITREQIAKSNKCSPARVSAIFGDMDQFRYDLVSFARDVGYDRVVCQAILDNHKAVADLDASDIKNYFKRSFDR